ncbi:MULTISPECIES: formate/nitrite transporter family protein [Methylobacterium]|uniref:Inner membrane protein YfdC n=1 Tax=Methylobacterium jeotgali TaxID=381630 RepID=A0ABQ4T218_9HYPH|nr:MULTISPECIES: formate/nitrite transporter family protein [Methylobacterium]PIU04528.1 MAG: transporter [Methylobacterium sp. CG09_land_8_20_14_0_10_71_15]PIU15398.1 MAG: transporter [Methylobacterium sp. CG08_land_8_20_14_0_20_71_15]GJE08313.1 Inner membrane protein YfdC [Methylobacterium jeotgali]
MERSEEHDVVEDVEEIVRPDAIVLHEVIRREGDEELRRRASALFLSAIAAGLSMGLSLIVPGVLKAHLPKADWTTLVTTMGYSVGFLVVVLGRQQLFTENTITPILPLLHDRSVKTFLKVARLWGIVLAGNILATLLIAWVLAYSDAFEPKVKEAFAETSWHAVAHPFWTTVTKAVVAGWMIALMVWILPATGPGAPLVIGLMTWLVSMCGLSHVVAGSIEAFYLVATGAIPMADYLGRFFVPTLLGNVFGGVTLVAALNYGQVAPDMEEKGVPSSAR